jgi:hypothetical protein
MAHKEVEFYQNDKSLYAFASNRHITSLEIGFSTTGNYIALIDNVKVFNGEEPQAIIYSYRVSKPRCITAATKPSQSMLIGRMAKVSNSEN